MINAGVKVSIGTGGSLMKEEVDTISKNN